MEQVGQVGVWAEMSMTVTDTNGREWVLPDLSDWSAVFTYNIRRRFWRAAGRNLRDKALRRH